MIVAAKSLNDGLVRVFDHTKSGVKVKRIGGLVESEFVINQEIFSKSFYGSGWIACIENKEKPGEAIKRVSGFEGDIIAAEKKTKATHIAQPSLL